MRKFLQKICLNLTLLVAIIGLARPAHALEFYLLESASGISYTVLSNPGVVGVSGSFSLTQLVGNEYGMSGLTGSMNGIQETFLLNNAPLIAPTGQAVIPQALNFINPFDATGTGTIHFQGGVNLISNQLFPFSGTPAILDETSTVFSNIFNLIPPATEFSTFGFNLGPGQHPTTRTASFGDVPTDGIFLAPNSSVVFQWAAHPNTGIAYGLAGLNADRHGDIVGGSYWITTRDPQGSSAIPEPASILLFSTGLIAAINRNRKRLQNVK